MSKIIFLIGPGGVGKTTSGEILAKLIDFTFIDLDSEFIAQIGHIGYHIRNYGYDSYAENNSKLFFEILKDTDDRIVFAMSSGFLISRSANPQTKRHLNAISEKGISILLLPDRDVKKSAEIVVKRQMSRGFNLNEERELEKYIKRHPIYAKYGDIKVYSHKSPKQIAEIMRTEISEKFYTF